MRPGLLINAKWRMQSRRTGVQRYAEGLSRALLDTDLKVDFATPERAGRVRAALWEQRTLPRLARRYEALLCPANMAPTSLPEGTDLLVVIHCLRYRFHPESYSAAFVRWYERMIPRIIERARIVYTVSNAQRIQIEAVYPHARGKLEVLPPGLDPVFRPDRPRDMAAPAGAYLLCLSSSAPAKNLSTLLRAYERYRVTMPLVLAGVDQREADILCPSSVRGRVFALGHINDQARVASLLAHAEALLAPSRYESFGLPCLEAMGCATPVIASDLPAHREVCADAACFVDPEDADAWGEWIERVIEDEGLRRRLSRAGRERASSFRWSHAARIVRDAVFASRGAPV